MNRWRILLVDDHAIVREGLKRVLETQEDMELVGDAADGAEAIARATELRPDIVLMDLSMPGLGGVDAARQLATILPEARVIALTVHESLAYAAEFLKSGARGYLLKRAPTDELLRAVRSVGAGEVYVDSRISEALVQRVVGSGTGGGGGRMELSERETEVLRYIALGYANKEIADRLGVSMKSIETYKARAMDKLELKSRVDVVRLACERGWYGAGRG